MIKEERKCGDFIRTAKQNFSDRPYKLTKANRDSYIAALAK